MRSSQLKLSSQTDRTEPYFLSFLFLYIFQPKDGDKKKKYEQSLKAPAYATRLHLHAIFG